MLEGGDRCWGGRGEGHKEIVVMVGMRRKNGGAVGGGVGEGSVELL